MKKKPRSKQQKKVDKLEALQRMSETKPNNKASEAFKRKPYSVTSYLTLKGYDAKKSLEVDKNDDGERIP